MDKELQRLREIYEEYKIFLSEAEEKVIGAYYDLRDSGKENINPTDVQNVLGTKYDITVIKPLKARGESRMKFFDSYVNKKVDDENLSHTNTDIVMKDLANILYTKNLWVSQNGVPEEEAKILADMINDKKTKILENKKSLKLVKED